ncbi:MAG TPA: MCE family protein [Streptosporangiaceae bacterium]|jgi:phospholipid/cholesterol/gamma-HCH transport system substrate-binding protein
MRISFRERNPVPIGLVGIAVIVVGLLVAMNLSSIPFVGGGTTYRAAFAEAAGLKTDEEVRIAGVKVGKVTGLDLEGDHVKVTFQVDRGVRVGDLSRAEIKIKTVLGAHYLALDPRGPGKQDPGKEIPVSRTSTPFEIVPAVSELSQRVDAIDVKQLAKSFDTLSATFKDSPEEVRASLRGLRRLSTTIASRDDQLHELVGRARNVTQVLADRSQQFNKLINDADKILRAVQARRAVIHQLLINTVALSQQLNGLIAENQAQLRPALANLQRVNQILLRNQDNLDRILQLWAPFARQFTDATGTGRWFDSYIQNLIPIPNHIENAPGGAPQQGQQQQQKQPNQQQQNGRQRPSNPLPFLP